MASKNLIAAVSVLRDALLQAPEFGRLERSTKERISFGGNRVVLSAVLIDFYTVSNPIEFSIPWVAEPLVLFGLDELETGQEGYKYQSGHHEEQLPNWNPCWLVIGDCSGDPIIVNTESAEGEVLFAMHGLGDWEPQRIAKKFEDFVLFLGRWAAFRLTCGEIFGEDGLIRERITSAFHSKLADHLGEAERNFLGYFMFS